MAEATPESRVRKGHVKWFDPGKGFGFIVSEDGGADILLHANVLRNFGQSTVAEGAAIEIIAQQTDRGWQAVEVLEIHAVEPGAMSGLADFAEIDPAELAAQPLQPARVKWFDKGKGFGFVNVFGLKDDVFVHIEVLRRSGLADLMPGEAIALRTFRGKRGLMAVEVYPWDSALEDGSD